MNELCISSTFPMAYMDDMAPTPDEVNSVVEKLAVFYESFAFTKEYGHRATLYVCQMSARYAFWTLPSTCADRHAAVVAHAMWLSLVWIIDSAVDKGKVDASNVPLIKTSIMEALDQEQGGYTCPSSSFVKNFLAMIRAGYAHYVSLASDFRRRNEAAFDLAQTWTLKYIDSLDSSPSGFSLDEYANWRVVDGGMMCVIWHNTMFAGSSAVDAPVVFKQIALLTCYHNDILSFDRDVADETPNLVLFMRAPGDSIWDAFKKASDYVDDAIRTLSTLADNTVLDDVVRGVLSRIVFGAYGWGVTEDRYAKGVKLLACMESDDRKGFDAIINQKYVAAAGEMRTKSNKAANMSIPTAA